ncbi:hypothetical protein PRZ48_004479 [Zasmidium cellare]|uniref:MYND-type domain-containing protein n=1 Tax=Zasmidium cellare TaxID=395010 RepID=A0ABR0EQB0_ZASCE|nr:hypothetical protein PRZ48_004479 [Zasmidium cellare]
MDIQDTTTPNGSDGDWGLIIRSIDLPFPGRQQNMSRPVSFNDSLVKGDAAFKESALTAQLGFPLKVAPYPSEKGNYYNAIARSIFCEPDPASPNFLWPVGDNMDLGDVVLVRKDGQPISGMQFQALGSFVEKHIIRDCYPYLLGKEQAEVKEERKVQIAAKLTPEAFHTFFEDFRLRQVLKGLVEFRAVKSPVLDTLSKVDPACGHCLVKGKPEKPLFTCAKCKVRSYCGREHQKADWKEHKLVCGME